MAVRRHRNRILGPLTHRRRIFLLSPANLRGKRAGYLRRPGSTIPLAAELRSARGAPLGEVMQFASGLYFRGKLAYARAFAAPPAGVVGALIITPTAGLCSVDDFCTLETLDEFAQVDIAKDDPRYRVPLLFDARELASRAASTPIVLLGSVASDKYVDALLEVFGSRLLFPTDFIGRGDMSRGGLMLRAAEDGVELPYAPVEGAIRHGKRPPKLVPRRR